MTDTVKMPKPAYPRIYTEAQMKQYGDDREREALEMAAKLVASLAVTDCVDSNITRYECAEHIRALKEQIK